MNRKITIVLLLTLFFTVQSVFAYNGFTGNKFIVPPFKPVSYFAAVSSSEEDTQIPLNYP